MASRKVNVSAAVREHFEANATDKPKAIVTALKAKGIKVKGQYVSMVLSNLRKKSGKKGKKRGRPSQAASNGKASGSMGLQELRLAKDLVRTAGSVDRAKEALDVFAELTS